MGDLPVIKISPPGTFVELDGDALFLGRDCHLASLIPCLLSKVVSSRHCVIRKEGPDHWVLEDLGSTNGTWIRGSRLAGKTLLHTGEEFTLGTKGPLIECRSGFGGTGADRTIPEGELEAVADAPTLLEAPAPAGTAAGSAKTRVVDDRDGSADRPLRVGRPPTLRLVHEHTGEELVASGYSIVIGRDPTAAQIVIRAEDEKHVSGRHTEIQFHSDGTAVVRDLGSRNGTWLNDRPVKRPTPLKIGDRLLLGNAPTVLVVAALEL
jgi:pSer/pThr/pTyr-binding forkhead associated (FHA) protein